MKVLCVFAALIALSIAASDEQHWANFKKNHGKQYKGLLDEKLRFTIFQDNLNKIEAHNKLYDAGKTTYTMAVNQFADMTQEEFVSYLNRYQKPARIGGTEHQMSNIPAAAAKDWRNSGAVTNIKDQGQCGSCWSFSATASLEGVYEIAHGNLVSFSEQALVDCSTAYGNGGCNGGSMELAFNYIKDHGLPTEDDYPYHAVDESCKSFTKAIDSIKGYGRVKEHDEDALLDAVSNVGPIAVAVDASYYQFYSGGIYSDELCTEKNLNHGVAIVGYDSEGGKDYWIVKNSWGTPWGENGYIKMLRGINQCGISADASYPLL